MVINSSTTDKITTESQRSQKGKKGGVFSVLFRGRIRRARAFRANPNDPGRTKTHRKGNKGDDLPTPHGKLVNEEITGRYEFLWGESAMFFEFGFFEDLGGGRDESELVERERRGVSERSRVGK